MLNKSISFDDFLSNPDLPSLQELQEAFAAKYNIAIDEVPNYGPQLNYSLYYNDYSS